MNKTEEAIALYRQGRLGAKEAKQLSGLTWYEWAEVCSKTGLPWNIVDITPDELKRDVENAFVHSRLSVTKA